MALKSLSHPLATDRRWSDNLDTPSVVIDLDVAERNLRRGADFAKDQGLSLRPHIKTHKIPVLAKAQLELGAVGITAQKISEAEVMVDEGITDVLISYNIIGEQKLHRLKALAERCQLRTVADNVAVVKGLSNHFCTAMDTIGVLVEIDGGLNRCGVSSTREAIDVARAIDTAAGLRFDGFMVYPGPGKWKQALDFLAECKATCLREGLRPTILSTGGTPDMLNVNVTNQANEYRVGTYIYNDRSLIEFGAAKLTDCALSVLTTVVSTPSETRAVVDAGSKSLSSDLLGLEGHGAVKGFPSAQIFALSEEHGHIEFPRNERPAIGSRLEIIPNHACVVSNLANCVQFVRGEFHVECQIVTARGAVF